MDPRDIKQRVAGALRSAGARPWLVGYDANGIQEIITSCGRPVSMRGASETITQFDRTAGDDPRTIFAGGGRGVCLAGSEGEAKELAEALGERFRDKTEYGVMAACYVPFDRDAEAESIRWLRHRLEIEKDAAYTPTPELPTQKELECAYCRQYPACIPHERDGEIEKVCKRCDKMIGEGREQGEMRRSLADIAEDQRIAAVSADGNNLGALFESLSSLEELAATSQAIKSIFARAHEKALEQVRKEKRVPLMTGGDDVRAFLAPSRLLQYVETLGRTVTDEANAHVHALGDLLSPDTADQLARLGVGIGAAVADVYYPAWRLMDYAHDLERNAKRSCYGGKEGSVFDFAVVRTEAVMVTDIEHARGKPDIRPLSLAGDEWSATLDKARSLGDIPGAQLGILAAESTMTPEEFGNLFRYQVARSDHWKRWYERCDVSWRDAEAVFKHRPDPGMFELLALLRLTERPS